MPVDQPYITHSAHITLPQHSMVVSSLSVVSLKHVLHM